MSFATTGARAETLVGGAVTALFVPGDRPDRYAKAASSGADIVIIDLEDAVATSTKFMARACAIRALSPSGIDRITALVRVNAADTRTHDAEIAELADLAKIAGSGLLGVMVPKAEDPSAIADLVERMAGAPLAIVALIESAIGVLNAGQIALIRGVTRLALGAMDLTADVDADLDSPIVTNARTQLVLASRAARIAAPLDSPTIVIDDTGAVEDAARLARATGCGGMLCVHPLQLAPVRNAFRPTGIQVSWAKRVVEATSAAGEAAIQVDGQMIDKPVIDRAKAILRRAGSGSL